MQRLKPNETTRSCERGRGSRTLILPAGRDPPAHHTCLDKTGVAGKPCKEGGPFFTGQPPPHSFKTPTVRVSRPSASSRTSITCVSFVSSHLSASAPPRSRTRNLRYYLRFHVDFEDLTTLVKPSQIILSPSLCRQRGDVYDGRVWRGSLSEARLG